MTTEVAAGLSRNRWRLVTGDATDRHYLPDVVAGGTTFVVLLALVMSGWQPLLSFDTHVVRTVQSVVAESDLLLSMARTLTFVAGGEVSFVLLSSVTLWFAIRGATRAAGFVAISGLGALIFDEGVKALVGRLRPVMDVPVAAAVGPSFPSGHALNATITFGVLLLVALPAIPRRRHSLVSLAAVVVVVVLSSTRVALGVHFFFDVVAAWGLGTVWLAVNNHAFIPPRNETGDDRSELYPVAAGRPALPHGWLSAAQLVSGGVVIWGLLLAGGTLLRDPQGVALEIDRVVLEWMVSTRVSVLTDFLSYVGWLGGTAGILTVLVLACTVTVAALCRWRPALFIVVAVAGETVLFLGTATIVERSRPDSTLIQELPPTTSFPSGHVAAAVALYGALALLIWFYRRDAVGVAALVIAVAIVAAVALSRLYEGAHYFTDVVASVAYVAIWLTICWSVIRPFRPNSPPPRPVTDG